jgi:hypothetical protein
MADIDAMMAKVAKLIATAESYQASGNSEAAATYRTKAESLMREYRIAEEELVREAVSSGAPIWKTIEVSFHGDEWQDEHHSMFYGITAHCGVEYHLNWERRDGKHILVADVVGYEIDLRLVEMIWAAARLAFLAKLEPSFDPTKTAKENVYWLRGSGMNRQKVAKMVFGQEGHQEGIRVGQLYREACAERGEVDAVSGRGFNPKAYRAAYADQFKITINRRLKAARDAADSERGALVLPQRAERVKEALYAKYPSERPMSAEERAEAQRRMEEERANETPEQKKARQKRERQLTRYTAADRQRHERLYGPAAQRARAAGAEAASGVDLVRGAERPNRAEGSNRSALEG